MNCLLKVNTTNLHFLLTSTLLIIHLKVNYFDFHHFVLYSHLLDIQTLINEHICDQNLFLIISIHLFLKKLKNFSSIFWFHLNI